MARLPLRDGFHLAVKMPKICLITPLRYHRYHRYHHRPDLALAGWVP